MVEEQQTPHSQLAKAQDNVQNSSRLTGQEVNMDNHSKIHSKTKTVSTTQQHKETNQAQIKMTQSRASFNDLEDIKNKLNRFK